jgi:hypothetical protein
VIPMAEANSDFRSDLRATIRLIGAEMPSVRTPSERECMFCDIGQEDCPERIETTDVPECTDHDLF